VDEHGDVDTAVPTDRPTPARRRRDINWWRLSAAAIVAVSLVGIVIGFMSAETGSRQDRFPEGLEAVAPNRDAQVQRQSRVDVDLASGYAGELSLNGIPIAQDRYSFDPGQNVLSYPCLASSGPVPGAPQPPVGGSTEWPDCTVGVDGDDIPVLPTPEVTFTVRLWLIEDGPGASSTYTWTFKTY
jgi:hypothetical protein